MIFSTELANEVKLSDNGNNTKYLEAGIHDNVKFASAKFAESPTGKKFIEFTFEKMVRVLFILNGNQLFVKVILKNRIKVKLLTR